MRVLKKALACSLACLLMTAMLVPSATVPAYAESDIHAVIEEQAPVAIDPVDAEQDVKSPTYEPSDNHGMGMFFRAKSGNRYSATIRAEYGLYSTKLSAYYENPMSHGETLFVWLSPSMGSPTPMLVRLPNAWTPAYGNSATVHSGDIQSIVTARTGGPFVKSASATLNKSTHSYNVSCSLGASSYKFGSWVTYVGDNTGVIGDKNPGSNTIYDPLVYVSSWVDTNASGAYRSDMEGERELYIAGATYSNRSYGVATYDRYVHYQAKALSGRTVTKVIKLPAVKRFKIKYNGNGTGVTNMPADSSTLWSYQTATVSSQVPKRDGYRFDGWFTSTTGGTRYAAGTRVTNRSSDLNLYARWTPLTRRLTYVKNAPSGSTGGDSNVTLSRTYQDGMYGKPWGELATASKPGYTFKGWYTERGGGVRITSDTIAKGNLTVYAHWAPVEYTIRFNGNGDKSGCDVTGSMPSIKVKYDQVVNLPANKFKATIVTPAEDEGGEAVVKPSVFNGWNQNADAMRPSLADKASVMNLVASNGAVVDLYAVWDNAPMFIVESYPDRYFTLEEAQAGDIDEEELLSTVVVKDRETNPLPHKTTEQVEAGDDVGVSIVGWDASEFTDMTDDGVVSIRYQVKDEAGNKAYLNIKVTVTKNGPLPAEEYSFYRAISDKYTGTLPAESRWLTDYTYQQALGDAFSGEAKTHSYTLNGGLLDEIRAYVKTHGFGNSENPDALNGLFGSFGD